MARTHALVVLAAITLGTGLWFYCSQPEPDAPPLPATSRRLEPDPANASDPASGRVEFETPGEAPSATGTLDIESTPVPRAAGEAPFNVDLLVRDLSDHAPLAAFTWQFVVHGREPQRGEGTDGRARLDLPPRVSGQLLVESPRMEAHTRHLDTPAAGMPALRLEVFLSSRAPASGVTLTARDEQGAPVTRLRLDLWQLTDQHQPPAANGDPAHDPLWKRVGDDTEGLFVLPTIASGRYALRAQPIDDDGATRPLQPARFQFAFAGHEAVPLVARFVHGYVLRIESPEDGGAATQFAVVTRLRGEVEDGIWWQSRDASGRTVVAADTALLPGRVETLLALPPESYAIELRTGDRVLRPIPGPTTIGAIVYRFDNVR
ncbi:MAG: hypothetical protein ABL997_00655 [Planctomycetota bacterium]